MRVCISRSVRSTLAAHILRFHRNSAFTSSWLHLAEVSFYEDGSTCLPDTILNETSPPIISESDQSTTALPISTGTTTTMGNTEDTSTAEGSNITIIVALVVISISIICIIITIMIVFISARHFSPRYKNNTSADIPLREGHTTHGQVMCEETGQVHYSAVQSNLNDPSDQKNQFNDDQNVEQPPAQLLSIQVDGENKIISTATQEEPPPFAFAVYSQIDKEKRNEGRNNESTPSLNPEPSFLVDEMYAQVDKKKAPKKSIPPQPCSPVDQLYAQVDKNKKKEKSTPQLEKPSSSIDQLYAQVDKTNNKKASKKMESTLQPEEPPSSIDQLYAQVDKTNKKKASKKLESTPTQMPELFQLMDNQVNKKDTDVLPFVASPPQ